MDTKKRAESLEDHSENPILPNCGIVMPISGTSECSESHWTDVREILSDAITDAGFKPSLVSEADDVGIIQKRIIQNLYENPIVVCDVSSKNPNVMFELGLRLAFDKPTIIIKDDKTTYSFDTSPIEHLSYPRDLRFAKIIDFKSQLIQKIKGTHKQATENRNYTTFLKHFGTFTVAKIDTQEVTRDQFILEELKELRQLVASKTSQLTEKPAKSKESVLCIRDASDATLQKVFAILTERFGALHVGMESVQKGRGHYHFSIDPANLVMALELAKPIAESARILNR